MVLSHLSSVVFPMLHQWFDFFLSKSKNYFSNCKLWWEKSRSLKQFCPQKIFPVVMISSRYLNSRCIYKVRYNVDRYIYNGKYKYRCCIRKLITNIKLGSQWNPKKHRTKTSKLQEQGGLNKRTFFVLFFVFIQWFFQFRHNCVFYTRSLVYQRPNEKENTEAWTAQSGTVTGNCQREKLGNSWTKSIRQGDTAGLWTEKCRDDWQDSHTAV